MALAMLIFGIVFIVLAVAIHFYVQRKKFYRRNQAGLETFKTYSASVFTPFLEGFLKILKIVLFLAGLLFVFVGWYNL